MPSSLNLIKLSVNTDTWLASVEISLWLIAAILLIVGLLWLWASRSKRYKLVKLNIQLGKVGKAEFVPNDQDIQIAHKIWTELVTRKAALPIDPEHDVIVEVYDSWYHLFTKVRELISNIPADLLRSEESTKELVRIATETLNEGLRPHLTKWQAKYRNWYTTNSDKLKECTPQELQQQYPDYNLLVQDIVILNGLLIAYAYELKKIVDGKNT